MKYFLIVGEASGDLHASRLMQALRQADHDAEFRFYGGDLMSAVGGERLKHYRQMAYMGFVTVLLHLPQILNNLRRCEHAIRFWRPDVVILVDYPGFNLKVAEYVHRKTDIPVFYFIAPKIWAWKEYRIKRIRRDVDELFSILPFEVDFFEKKHRFPIHYIGNPTVDEVADFRERHTETFEAFAKACGLEHKKPVIALLPGSRKQEIRDNLPVMYQAVKPFVEKGYQVVLTASSAIESEYYGKFLSGGGRGEDIPVTIVRGMTFRVLQQAEAALVTSGTATLEAALFNVPQVVCYRLPFGRFYSYLRKRFLKVPYISLVNLIAHEKIVTELVADEMTVERLRNSLKEILMGGGQRQMILGGYQRVACKLGPSGAPERAASLMYSLLRHRSDRLMSGQKESKT